MAVEDQRVCLDGVGYNVGHYLGFFYANYDMVGSRYSNWLQHLMNVLIGLFQSYSLAANIVKSRTMT